MTAAVANQNTRGSRASVSRKKRSRESRCFGRKVLVLSKRGNVKIKDVGAKPPNTDKDEVIKSHQNKNKNKNKDPVAQETAVKKQSRKQRAKGGGFFKKRTLQCKGGVCGTCTGCKRHADQNFSEQNLPQSEQIQIVAAKFEPKPVQCNTASTNLASSGPRKPVATRKPLTWRNLLNTEKKEKKLIPPS